jgi:CRP/FNR family transcriptional regulator, cyclic AMP receptor protein
MDNIDVLKNTMIFCGLSDDELKLIADSCTEEVVPMGAVIIEENDPPREILYIVKEGEIAISTQQAESENGHMLTTMGEGEAFGEISLIDNSPHSASVRAMTDSVILCFSAGRFDQLVQKDRNIGYMVMRNLAKLICERLRTANFTIKHFGYFGKVDDPPFEG